MLETLRVYIIELQSTKWKDYNGNWYYHAFLDFAFNQAITISAGETYTDSTIWDGVAARISWDYFREHTGHSRCF